MSFAAKCALFLPFDDIKFYVATVIVNTYFTNALKRFSSAEIVNSSNSSYYDYENSVYISAITSDIYLQDMML